MNWIVFMALFGLAALMNEVITLEDLKWKKRVLLIFPNNEGNSFEWEVSDSLAKEIEERDLVYFLMADTTLHTNSSYSFSPEYQQELLKQYALGSKKSCYVLIGKDGGSKVRKEEDMVNWKDLFATIDAMPMRQREMGSSEKFFE
jgi:hypothetical protein